jgi:hypothetical protein
VYSWGDLSSLYEVKSVTVSLIGASLIGASLLGLAVDDGLLALSDSAETRMAGFGVPAAGNTATGWLGEITIEQLATQSSGFDTPHGYCDLIFRPGVTEWSYSACGVNWLADVLTTRYKKDLYDVANNRLFTPLGIDPSMLTWRNPRYRLPGRLEVDPGVRVTRRFLSSGIFATPNALARLGLLYLREGKWRGGQRILPQSFVQQVGVPQASILNLPVRNPAQYFDASRHFGLLWWNNGDGRLAGVPTDAYWAWGYLRDSLVFVIPSLDLVVVRTGASWLQSSCLTDRRDQFCPDYAVLDKFISPIVASVMGVATNAAPVVDAGQDGVADLAPPNNGIIALTGSATDDGPVGLLGYAWSVVSAPPLAPAPTFSSPTSANTNATFGALGTYVLELSANDNEITAYDHVVVRVKDSRIAIPTATISASPLIIAEGTRTTLTWSSTDATSCVASGAWTGSQLPSGSFITAELTTNSTFGLLCTGPGGDSALESVFVEVEAAPSPTNVNLTAQPASITTGSSATLTWTTTEAESCTASGGWTGSKSATGGSEIVTPATTTTYTLHCVGTTEDTAAATVTVSAPPPPPPPRGGGGGGTIDWWLIAGLLALVARVRSLTTRKSAISR